MISPPVTNGTTAPGYPMCLRLSTVTCSPGSAAASRRPGRPSRTVSATRLGVLPNGGPPATPRAERGNRPQDSLRLRLPTSSWWPARRVRKHSRGGPGVYEPPLPLARGGKTTVMARSTCSAISASGRTTPQYGKSDGSTGHHVTGTFEIVGSSSWPPGVNPRPRGEPRIGAADRPPSHSRSATGCRVGPFPAHPPRVPPWLYKAEAGPTEMGSRPPESTSGSSAIRR